MEKNDMKIKYVLFDLDGTLTDPAEGITASVNYALKKFGRDVDDMTLLYKYIGPPLVRSFIEFEGMTQEEACEGLKYYRENFIKEGIFQNEIYVGIEELLIKLKNSGYAIILATSKPEELAEQILEHFDIKRYFDFIAGNTLDEKRQTKREVIGHILNHYPEIERENAIMVGDRRYDVEGAAQCGIDTIGVLYGYGGAEELSTAGAKLLARSPEDVYTKILMLEKE